MNAAESAERKLIRTLKTGGASWIESEEADRLLSALRVVRAMAQSCQAESHPRLTYVALLRGEGWL